MRNHWVALAGVQLMLGAYAGCQEATAVAGGPLPSGDAGIASKYPDDAGIEKDPAVVFADGFEACSKVGDLHRKWDNIFQEHCIRFAEEPENVHGGRKALEFTVPQQAAELSNAVVKVLKQEHDVLFLRYYSKFEKGFDQIGSSHNGAVISAHYDSGGHATPGIRADGRNKFLAAFEDWRGEEKTPSPGHLNIYCYHPEQRDNYGDHFFPSGKVFPYSPQVGNKNNFGKEFVSHPDLVPELDRWYCYEFMVKANTVGQRDGRIACWLDGQLIADFTNLRLRDVETLKIDQFCVGLHIKSNTTRANKKWYDDVVAATSYVGPMVKEKKAPPKPVANPVPKLPPAPEKPPPPAFPREALAPWEAKLVERVAQGLKEGQRPTALMKVVGAQEEPAKVLGADGKSLSVELQGGKLDLPWTRLSARDRTNLARAFLKEGVLEDHVLVAVFALADGRAELSDEHFAKAKAADPKGGEARVAEARASLGLK